MAWRVMPASPGIAGLTTITPAHPGEREWRRADT
jgi:hypothetical protein